MYEYCEEEGLKYVIGLIRNDVLERMIKALLKKAHDAVYRNRAKAEDVYKREAYQAGSWEKERRVIMKAEWLTQGPNSRFVVTNLSHEPKELYEFYTERGGTCEVRIDEFKNGLKADRLSCHRFVANQFRLFLHMAAYWLVLRLREALRKTEFASMQIQQLRLTASEDWRPGNPDSPTGMVSPGQRLSLEEHLCTCAPVGLSLLHVGCFLTKIASCTSLVLNNNSSAIIPLCFPLYS